MRILVIEDEEPASKRLVKLLLEIDPSIQIEAITVSVVDSIKYLQSNPNLEVIFSDIQLSDGLSFEIFQNVQIDCPIIFVTAFNQYAIQAFKCNGIDYLLKPIKKEELKLSIEKYNRFLKKTLVPSIDLESLIQSINGKKKDFQKRLVIRFHDVIKTVEIAEIAYFFNEDRITQLRTFTNTNYPVDFNLDELEQLLNPKQYFRINRQFIVNISAIERMTVVSKSRVKLNLLPQCQTETIVSTERSASFKEWLSGK